MDSIVQWLESFLKIPPSSYIIMFPDQMDGPTLDAEAEKGNIPTLDLLLPHALYYAVVLSIIRYILHHILLKPVAVHFRKLKYPKLSLGNSNYTEIQKIIIKKNEQKVTKFVEAAWRALFYLIFLYYGFKAIYNEEKNEWEPWVTDTRHNWIGWGTHEFTDDLRFFYIVELGAYIHQLMWTEVSRKDSFEMILHHISTILLIGFSYLCVFLRIGSLIMVLHDTADVFLETAKCFNYAATAEKKEALKQKRPESQVAKTVCDVLFGIFAVVFFVTRIVLYPSKILYSVFFECSEILVFWNGLALFDALLLILQCLHVFWFYTIATMIYRLLTTGIEKDERSDDDDDDDDYDDESAKDK